MSNHTKALLPLESWCYQSPELRFSGKSIDIGLFAEGLIYYESILLNITNQPQLADFILWFQKQNKYKELLSLFENGVIQLYDYSFATAAIGSEGKYQIWNIQDPIQQKENTFEQRFLYHESLNSCFKNARERINLYRVLRGKVKEVKADQFSLSVENAKLDYYDAYRAKLMVQAFIDEISPLMEWKKTPEIEVDIQKEGTETEFTFNISFDEIAKKLGPDINFHLGTPLTGIAHCNRLIQSGIEENCDLFLGNPMSTLVGDKLLEAHSRNAQISGILESLSQEVEYPDIRSLVNNGKMNFQDILEIRKKAKKFRQWLQSESERDRNAIIAYHNEVAKESGIIVNARKALNLFGFIGGITAEVIIANKMGGVEGQIIGATTNGGITFLSNLASKLNSNWRPIVFGKWLENKSQKHNNS